MTASTTSVAPTAPVPPDEIKIIEKNRIAYRGKEYIYTVRINGQALPDVKTDFQDLIVEILRNTVATKRAEIQDDLSQVKINSEGVTIKGNTYNHSEDLKLKFANVTSVAIRTLPAQAPEEVKEAPEVIEASLEPVEDSALKRKSLMVPKENGEYEGLPAEIIFDYFKFLRDQPTERSIVYSNCLWTQFGDKNGEFQVSTGNQLEKIFGNLTVLATKEEWLIPINWSGSHYGLAKIDFKNNKISYFDSHQVNKELYNERKEKLKLMPQQLSEFMLASGNQTLENKATRLAEMSISGELCPQQENSYDCGVFVMGFVEELSQKNPILIGIDTYTKEQVKEYRTKLADQLYPVS